MQRVGENASARFSTRCSSAHGTHGTSVPRGASPGGSLACCHRGRKALVATLRVVGQPAPRCVRRAALRCGLSGRDRPFEGVSARRFEQQKSRGVVRVQTSVLRPKSGVRRRGLARGEKSPWAKGRRDPGRGGKVVASAKAPRKGPLRWKASRAAKAASAFTRSAARVVSADVGPPGRARARPTGTNGGDRGVRGTVRSRTAGKTTPRVASIVPAEAEWAP